MKKICLVTTSLENSEIEGDNIYLGNWCKNESYIIKNKKVVSYHWDDRTKLEKDSIYINELYERILTELSNLLNKVNKKNYSKEYWRMVVGYWLYLFLSSTFDKWESLERAFTLFKEINYTKIFTFHNKESLISGTTKEFANLCSSTEWNHFIYSEMINFLIKKKKINIETEKNYYTKTFSYERHRFKNHKKNLKAKIKEILITIYNKLTKNITKFNDVVIYKTSMGILNELKLNLGFIQLPFFIKNIDFKSKIDNKLRNELELKIATNNSYEKFIKGYIFKNLPKEFIEDYKSIDSYIENLKMPVNPKVVLATTIWSKETIFARYCAQKKELGTKLVACQHGGLYGHAKFYWSEGHEVGLSNKYLSWGWTDNNKKISKFGIIKNLNKLNFKKVDKITSAAYLLRSRPIFVHHINSTSGSNQMSNYYQNSINFFHQTKKLDLKIVPRCHEAMFNWNHLKIWEKEFGSKLEIKLTFDESLEKVYHKYDIIIYSYIGTGFLESLAQDKPFIIISSLDSWPLRKNAYDDFMSLKKAKILFDNNEEALEHLNVITNNLLNWWNSEFTKEVKKNFREKYAKKLTNRTMHKELKKILETYI